MMNDNVCAMTTCEPRNTIGDKARMAFDALSDALETAIAINAFLFTGENKDGQKTPVANCLDEELSVIGDKAKALAVILHGIREKL